MLGMDLGSSGRAARVLNQGLMLESLFNCVNRHQDQGSSFKGKHLIMGLLSFRGLAHYYHGGEHHDGTHVVGAVAGTNYI